MKWQAAAEDIHSAARTHLYNKERGAFYKGIRVLNDEITYNDTLDSSALYGAFMYGLFPMDSAEIASALTVHRETFGVRTDQPGVPRYEHDTYRRASENAPSNWWHVTTLWDAQYHIDQQDSTSALQILDWEQSHATNTGMLGEQINPETGEHVAPTPLTWSHAEYVSTLIDLIGK